MSLQGSTPFSPDARRVGAAALPVRPTRTQSLRPGDVILRDQKRYTVTAAPVRKPEGWLVTFSDASGATRTLTKPAGFSWSVLSSS